MEIFMMIVAMVLALVIVFMINVLREFSIIRQMMRRTALNLDLTTEQSRRMIDDVFDCISRDRRKINMMIKEYGVRHVAAALIDDWVDLNNLAK